MDIWLNFTLAFQSVLPQKLQSVISHGVLKILFFSAVTRPRVLNVHNRKVRLNKACGTIADCTFEELCDRVSLSDLYFFFLIHIARWIWWHSWGKTLCVHQPWLPILDCFGLSMDCVLKNVRVWHVSSLGFAFFVTQIRFLLTLLLVSSGLHLIVLSIIKKLHSNMSISKLCS